MPTTRLGWIGKRSGRKLPMTELVRQAVHGFRLRERSRDRTALVEALAQTAGLRRQGDGLSWQQRMRREG